MSSHSTLLFKKIEDYVIQYSLIVPNSKLVVGFSGGPDSVFLVHFLIFLKERVPFQIILAHLNHGWRASSEQDAQFCLTFAQSHSIELEIGNLANFCSQLKFNGSKEEFARNARRAFFNEVIKQANATALILGHHADDQIETFFIRLMRGTTATGLTCMGPKENNIIRPLLTTRKKDILTYLHHQSIPYCIDETNDECTFLRNKIRKFLIPQAEIIDKRFTHHTARAIAHLSETEQYLTQLTILIFQRITTLQNAHPALNLNEWKQLDPFMQKRVLVYWFLYMKVSCTLSYDLITETIRFLLYPHRMLKKHCFGQWEIIKDKDLASIMHVKK